MPTRPLVVGLCGYAQAGKSTVAQGIQNALSLSTSTHGLTPCQIMPVADRLKEGLRLMGFTKQSTPAAYRFLAQKLGTDLVRSLDEDHWVNQWESDLRSRLCYTHPPRLIVIDDIRFPNEDSLCDKVFLITRHPRSTSLTPEESSHASESFPRIAVKDFGATEILNVEGDVDCAVQEILTILRHHRSPAGKDA